MRLVTMWSTKQLHILGMLQKISILLLLQLQFFHVIYYICLILDIYFAVSSSTFLVAQWTQYVYLKTIGMHYRCYIVASQFEFINEGLKI